MERALALDDARPDSLVVASTLHAYHGRLGQAIALAERAITLAPSDAQAHSVLGGALIRAGRVEAGMRAHETAARLNPLDPLTAFSLGVTLFALGEHERAVAAVRRAVVHTPDFTGLHGMLAINYAELGRMDEARAAVAELQRISPEFTLQELEQRNLAGVEPELVRRVVAAARKAGLR